MLHNALIPWLDAHPYADEANLIFGVVVPLIGVIVAIVVFLRRRQHGDPAKPIATLAILALIFGLVVSVAGIICGHLALARIRRTGERGRGLAFAGLLIGYVITWYWLLAIIKAILSFSVAY